MKMVKRALAAGTALMLGSGPAMAAWDLNLRVGVTELSREIYGLHMLILWVCVVIAVAVFGVMIYSIATFRKSKGAVPATFDHLVASAPQFSRSITASGVATLPAITKAAGRCCLR